MPRTSNSPKNRLRSLKTDLSGPKTDLDRLDGHWDTFSHTKNEEYLYRLVWSADFNSLISYKALAVPDQLSTEHCTFKATKDYLLLNLYTSMGTIRGLDGNIKISKDF